MQAFVSPIAHRKIQIEAYPKIVRAESTVVVRLKLDDLAPVGTKLQALFLSANYPLTCDNKLELTVCSGWTEVTLNFEKEQEYELAIYQDGIHTANTCFYALNEDLFGRIPMKADFHMHTTSSDGDIDLKRAPAKCRRVGLDLMAITDHRLYEPSVEAIAYYQDIPIDLIMCPGEEIHAPDNIVHIVNLNGNASVNKIWREQEERYRAEVDDILKSMPESELTAGEKYAVASSYWVARKIKEFGGLAVFCHPYWMWYVGYSYDRFTQLPVQIAKYITDGMEDAIWASGEFDCVELIGGFGMIENDYDSDLRSAISYYEHLAKGQYLAPVGTSDCHRWEDDVRMGWYFTIAFAKEWSAQGFIDGVKEGYSVGCENYITRETGPRAWGSKRLCQYSQFLFREIYPEHDRLCEEESTWMDAAAEGDQNSLNALKKASGRTQAYMRACFDK